jgi:hypothetical protein
VLYPLSYEGVTRSELTESGPSRSHRASWPQLLEQLAPLVPGGGRGVVVKW